MDTMTITISQPEGIELYFKIQFERKNFFNIIDIVDKLTIDTVMNCDLFEVL